MRVLALHGFCLGSGIDVGPGDELELSDEQAKAYIEQGRLVAVAEPAADVPADAPAPADAPPARDAAAPADVSPTSEPEPAAEVPAADDSAPAADAAPSPGS